MSEQDKLSNPENNPQETSEQDEVTRQLEQMAENEAKKDKGMTRRSFIKKSVLAGLGLWVASALAPEEAILQTAEKTQETKTEDIEKINYKKILGESEVIFIADSHDSFQDKEAFRDALKNLSKLGVKSVALEMFPQGFNIKDKKAAKDYLQKYWEIRPGLADKYFELLTEAENLGMDVFGLDIPIEEYQSQNQKSTLNRRNQLWATLIEGRLKETQKKIVVFHGSAHTGHYPAGGRVNNILENDGHSSVLVGFFGGDNGSAITPEERQVENLIKENKIKPGSMLKISSISRGKDYIIYTGE